MIISDLDKIFSPDSIALIGASNHPYKWGSFIFVHLLAGGFEPERIFPVNPREEVIHNLKAYPTLADLPRPVDLAIITTPAKIVGQVLEDCAMHNIKHVVVISSN